MKYIKQHFFQILVGLFVLFAISATVLKSLGAVLYPPQPVVGSGNVFVTNIFVTNAFITNLNFNVGKGGKLTVETITNNNFYSSNAFITNLTVIQNFTNNNAYISNLFVTNLTANFVTNIFTTNLFTDQFFTNFYVSNLFATNIYVTNLIANFVTNVNEFVTTNNTFLSFTTNLFATTITNNTFVSSNAFITNLTVVNNLTNVTAYISNLFVTNLTVNNLTNQFITNTFVSQFITNLFTTNLTIIQPGGATNLNLTPKSLMMSDINDAETSLPNGQGVLTNDGIGNMGFTMRLSLTEIDAQNFYPTNTFTGITNESLGTDGNGKLVSYGSQIWTNVTGLGSGSTLWTLGNGTLPNAPASGGIVAIGDFVLNSLIDQAMSGEIAIGNNSLTSLTNGNNNTAFGINSFVQLAQGANNTAIGANAFNNNPTVGSQNTAIGENAGSGNGGTNNFLVAVGAETLFNVGDVDGLTAIGTFSLNSLTTGIETTAIGYNSGHTITTGSSNTFLGYLADAASATLSNVMAIGVRATPNANDDVVIGNANNNFNVQHGGVTTKGLTNSTSSIKVNGVSYSWPSTQTGGNLFDDGSGNLSWVANTNISIPNTIVPTNFVLNTRYTNNSGSIQLVDATIQLATAAVAGNASLSLYADQSGGSSFTLQDQAKKTTLLTSIAETYNLNLIGAISNNATYYFTNESAGAGNSSSIVAGTGERITLADGAAAGVATLGGANVYTGSQLGDGSGWTNLTGGNIKGGTKEEQYDSSFMWPGDTLAATWTTNTPSAASASIQSAGPSFKAWQFSTSATNQVLLQVPMPSDWDGNTTINFRVHLISGTNSAAANAITNIWSVSAARVGTALGTAVTITNNLPGGTGLIETNFDFASLVIAGSPKPGNYVIFQIQDWGGKAPFSSTNTLLLVEAGMRYNVTNVQNNVIQWP